MPVLQKHFRIHLCSIFVYLFELHFLSTIHLYNNFLAFLCIATIKCMFSPGMLEKKTIDYA